MSNLVKYNNIVIKNENHLVIDSNKMINELLEEQKRNFARRAAQPDEDGFVCGLDAATVEELVSESEVSESQQAQIDLLMGDANAKAQEIIDTANAEAIAIKNTAKDQGYAEGLAKAEADAGQMLNDRLATLESEYQNKMATLEAEYQEMKSNLEPELVNTLLEVFSRVTKVFAEDKKDLIISLANEVIENAEMSKEFIIRVSEEDYAFVVNNKDTIYGAASPEYHIEVVKDTKLAMSQCVIETDAGVFDCSLDIQLENLLQEIKLLSCAR